MKRWVYRFLGVFLLTLGLLTGTLSAPVEAQPYSAQIQRALNAFVGAVHTWTATQTFTNVVVNGTCTGCASGAGQFSSVTITAAGTLSWGSTGFASPDVFQYRSAAKTLKIDTDGAGGALTLVDVKGPLSATTLTSAGTIVAGSGSEFRFPSSTRLLDVNDGIPQLANSAKTGITRVVLGTNDATTNGASLNLASGVLEVKTGDGSAFAALRSATFSLGNGNFAVASGGTFSTYGNIATVAKGVAAIYGYGDTVAATNVGTASIATYTAPASDGTYNVGCNILVTTSTTHSFSCDVTYTDEGNTARTMVLPVVALAGTFVTSGLITNITGVGPYESPKMTIRVKASTAITVRTSAGGTFTTVTYNARGYIQQIS